MSDETTGLLVAGDLYMDVLKEDGTSQGFLEVANATQMALQQNVEFQELISRKRATRGQLLHSVAIPSPGEINLTLNEINRDQFKMALLGDAEDVNTSSETFTDTPVTLKGYRWTEIGKRNLKSTGFSVSLNSTELTQGTDFEVNYRQGLIRALEGSSELTGDADAVTVTGETNALSGYKVRGAVKPQIRAKLLVDGRNMVNDRSVVVRVDQARLRPNEAIDFLAEQFVNVQMTGRMETLPGKDSPFSVEMINAE